MSVLCDSTGRVPGFLCTSSHVPFSFLDSALYPFAIISHNEYDYILSPVSPPSASSNLGVPLGTFNMNCLGDIWIADINATKEELGVMASTTKFIYRILLNIILLIHSFVH